MHSEERGNGVRHASRDFLISERELETIDEDEEVEEFMISDFSQLPQKQEEERFEPNQQIRRLINNKIYDMPDELKSSLTGSLDKSKHH